MTEEERLAVFVACALSRHVVVTRRNGGRVPAGVGELAEMLLTSATARQGATNFEGPAEPRDDGHMEHPLLTKRETATALRTSVRTVERLIADGSIKAVLVAGSTRIRRAELDAYLAALAGDTGSFRDSVQAKEPA